MTVFSDDETLRGAAVLSRSPIGSDGWQGWLMAGGCAAALALLSACASQSPPMTATQEAATYQARAKPSYTPPGPPDDPWGPYIVEASHRFDVPERWIREVMRVESGAHEFNASGALITSPVGAMGLMQLMPETYDEVRAQYNLGDDAFDPHNNILAGAAYIRQMYDAFGTPGFLAAYNGGPARLEDYLVHNRPLPTETRRYVAMIGPYVEGIYPQSRSPAEQLAVNHLPIDIPAGPRYVVHHAVMVASRERRAHGHERDVRYAVRDSRGHATGAIELAEAPPPRSVGAHTLRVAYTAPTRHAGGWHLIDSAEADTLPHGFAGAKSAARPATHAVSHATGAHESPSRKAHTASSHGPAVHASVATGHTASHGHTAAAIHEAAVHSCRKSAHHGCSTAT
jgi:hypothetical protein